MNEEYSKLEKLAQTDPQLYEQYVGMTWTYVKAISEGTPLEEIKLKVIEYGNIINKKYPDTITDRPDKFGMLYLKDIYERRER
jgi:hypothetical protein